MFVVFRNLELSSLMLSLLEGLIGHLMLQCFITLAVC